ncbi:MAG: helix-turn-helix transcriptional regulator [Bacteroidales bacterium]
MQERILQLLKELNLSSSKLAEEIDVQRSSISHILAGRNKPSFVFIQKLLKRYPQINSRWLLLGEGSPLVKNIQTSMPFHQTDNQKNTELTSRESNIHSESPAESGITNSEKNKISEKVSIKKIVIFYSDNHFEEYLPKTK